VAFLNARLDEDEAIAKTAAGRRRQLGGTWTFINNAEGIRSGDGVTVVRRTWPQEAAHIVRWDPARVLADVQAKRAMLPHLVVEGHPLGYCDRCMCLRLLASVWADHPEFDQSWKL
jgi:hypothetical protein